MTMDLRIEATLTDRYHFMLKVCIQRPCRPEGEYEQPEEELTRKLSSFYLEAHYEHPESENRTNPAHFHSDALAHLIVGQQVDHFDVLLDSPVFESEFSANRWYSVDIFLFRYARIDYPLCSLDSDSTKSELLGRHYQLIYHDTNVIENSARLII